ncbi:MAG TPA: DUF1326 domain-containing protein [Candidatus Nitrosotalea sp.]|nr:DUF1326 domain-containing protein [Candidatus Nitrosotalea sp.]
MKRMAFNRSIISFATLCAFIALVASGNTLAAAGKVSWKISAELEEGCSCRAACPCWFKSLPSRMTCDGLQAVFITRGHYGKVSLDGLAVGEVIQSPEHQSMFESFGKWNFEYIYIDEKADARQREALKEVAMHLFPPGAKSREYRFVPITRKIDGGEHLTTIGTYAVCSGHLIEGGYDGAPKVINPPLADPTHKAYLQGETTKLTYTDAGQNWNYEHSNYMRNKFEVDSKEYEKYEAAMAKKMGKM